MNNFLSNLVLCLAARKGMVINMYKAVIADDEPVIRSGLASMIKSANTDFEVTASFSTGEALIEYLKTNDIDVVFTDIVMYKLTGLDIAKYLHENKPYIKCVILSGYDRFEYAKSAISYNVFAYLLKPLDADELSVILKNLSETLKESKDDYEDESVLSTQFLSDIFTGVISNEAQLRRRASELGYDSELFLMPCIVLTFNFPNYNELLRNWKYETHSLNTALYHFLCEFFDYEIFPLYNTGGKIMLSVLGQTDEEYITESIEKNRHLFAEVFKTDMEYSMIHEKNMMNISDNIDLSGLLSYIGSESEILCNSLVTALLSGTLDEVKNIFSSAIRHSENSGIDNLRDNISGLFNGLFARLIKTGINLPKHMLSEVNFYTLAALKNSDEIRSWGIVLLKNIYGTVSQNTNSTEAVSIRNAKEFIADNLHLDISLYDVASHVYLNPIYFSKLFKQSTGITFTSYITQMRIEKAKELLCGTNLKIYEIGEQSGFRSTFYFNRVFKQIVGVTPNEFRRKE